MVQVQLNKKSTPFIVILIVQTTLLVFSIQKKGVKNTFRLLLPNIGIAYIFEYIVLNLLKAYIYKPNIVENKNLDNIIGAIMSQALFVPITATFITLFRVKHIGKILFATYFSIIEMLFLRLNVYKKLWWKTRYTFIFILLSFYMNDHWFKQMKRGKAFYLNASIYFSFFLIHLHVLLLYALLGNIRFGFKRFDWIEHFLLVPLYSYGVATIYTKNAIQTKSQSLIRQLFILSSLDLFIIKAGLLKITSWINLFLPLHVGMYFLGESLKSYMYDTKYLLDKSNHDHI